MKKFILVVLTLLVITSCSTRQVVDLGYRGNGIFEVPMRMGDEITCNFILDTGCSETSIPEHIFYHLLTTGVVKPEHMLEPAIYRLADGSTMECPRFRLTKLQIGDMILKDVTCSVTSSKSPLLLGQNVLENFRSIEIDYVMNVMVLKK